MNKVLLSLLHNCIKPFGMCFPSLCANWGRRALTAVVLSSKQKRVTLKPRFRRTGRLCSWSHSGVLLPAPHVSIRSPLRRGFPPAVSVQALLRYMTFKGTKGKRMYESLLKDFFFFLVSRGFEDRQTKASPPAIVPAPS